MYERPFSLVLPADYLHPYRRDADDKPRPPDPGRAVRYPVIEQEHDGDAQEHEEAGREHGQGNEHQELVRLIQETEEFSHETHNHYPLYKKKRLCPQRAVTAAAS